MRSRRHRGCSQPPRPQSIRPENKKPNKLDDLYGSTWVTAGAGSVLFLFGQPGADQVELIHLKQPEAKIEGPGGANLTLVHDHEAGRSKLIGRFDPLQFLYNKGDKGSDGQRRRQSRNKTTRPDRRESENRTAPTSTGSSPTA